MKNLIKKEKRWENTQDLKNAVMQWCDRLEVDVKEIQIRQMKRQWASISTNRRLTLNSELLDIPRELGEFVIVHELVHLIVPNHSKLFKCFMTAHLPDWEEREKKLKSH
ncbi:MAG: M48 family metallopeptidase [Crocosphaera sp.]